ncbi:MAG: hypothetical protein RB191_20785 [Terriglobia bacterium]|nr:hypothetical protein [Terriglobia bacterium]
MQKQTGSITSLATETLAKQSGVPATVRMAFVRTVGHATSGEQMLWREVAARMTLDALGITPEVITVSDRMDMANYRRYAKVVCDARVWFGRKQRDSELVFELAGVDMAPVRRAILALPPLKVPQTKKLELRRAA